MLVDGTSLIPNNGNQTQKIPPITSVKESKVNSAACIAFDPIEYKIKPKHTIVPCNENIALLKLVAKKGWLLNKIIIAANTKQNKPATATVVNFGVSFLHLRVTEKIEKPIEDVSPKTKPINEFFSVLPTAIIIMPAVAMIIDIQTFNEIFSFKKRKANKAVKKGIAAKHKRVIAAVVLVIEYINEIIAIPRPTPPTIPDLPILLYTICQTTKNFAKVWCVFPLCWNHFFLSCVDHVGPWGP